MTKRYYDKDIVYQPQSNYTKKSELTAEDINEWYENNKDTQKPVVNTGASYFNGRKVNTKRVRR